MLCRVAMAALVLGSGATAAFSTTHNWGSSMSTHGKISRCDQIEFSFDDRPAAREEQTFNIARSQAPTLRAHLGQGVGITIFAGASSDYVVHVCKAAAEAYSQSSRENLAAITAGFSNGELSAHGPDSGRWTAYLIVEAPAGAGFDLSTENGPLELRDLSGKITARAMNGPVSLERCTGEVDASTENGPLSFSGDSGKLRLRTQNGPLSISLAGERWNQGNLEGSTQNGPVSLSVAQGYSSCVLVESRGHSPVSCRECRKTQRTWDDNGRTIQIGGDPVVVRVSTVNGPVSVGPHGARDDSF